MCDHMLASTSLVITAYAHCKSHERCKGLAVNYDCNT